MQLLCKKCGQYFVETDSIVRVACGRAGKGYDYYHASCIGEASNITYEELEKNLTPYCRSAYKRSNI